MLVEAVIQPRSFSASPPRFEFLFPLYSLFSLAQQTDKLVGLFSSSDAMFSMQPSAGYSYATN
jgi:hypothetical protein